MSEYYTKQEFVDGETVLSAIHLQNIEEGIIKAFAKIPIFSVKTITLLASAWAGADGVYSQVVTLDGVTANSKVDLLPSPDQLHQLLTSEISLTTANSEGVITVFAIGEALSSDFTMQVMITEVTPG